MYHGTRLPSTVIPVKRKPVNMIVLTSTNPLDPEAWKRHDVPHVGEFLQEHYRGQWPPTAKIFRGSVALENDVTPTCAEEIDALEEGEEPLWVYVAPALVEGGAVALLAFVAIVTTVAALVLVPDVPIPTPRESNSTGSPNNQLGARSNKPRPLGRIPDIFGSVKVIPDVIMHPYTTYENNKEIEIGYYCIGRGEFAVVADQVRDGSSRIDQIVGAAAHVYSPGQAPTGSGPFSGDIVAIGDAIEDPVLNVFPIRAVSGQDFESKNTREVLGATNTINNNGETSGDFRHVFIEHLTASTGRIYLPVLRDYSDVRDRISVGDRLNLDIRIPGVFTVPTFDLSTSATNQAALASAISTSVSAIDGATGAPLIEENFDWATAPVVTALTDFEDWVIADVDIPTALQSDWAVLEEFIDNINVRASGVTRPTGIPDSHTLCSTCKITPVEDFVIGSFFQDREHPLGSSNHHVIANFVAPNGLYMDDGANIDPITHLIVLRVTPANSLGTPTGASEFVVKPLTGQVVNNQSTQAVTIRFTPSFEGRFLVSAYLATASVPQQQYSIDMARAFLEPLGYPLDFAYTGRVVDKIKWTHCYSVSTPPNISFGDITTVHTKTITPEGSAPRERELNITCTRMTNTWKGAVTGFTGPLASNNLLENFVFTICKDLYMGNLPDEQIDFEQIANEAQLVRDNFASSAATALGITLDDSDTSFEETLATIGEACFCTFYRVGNVLRMKAEVEQSLASGVFNHRNILPGTQDITHRFGKPADHDSIEVDYTDANGSPVTVTVPSFGGTFSRPKAVRIFGLISRAHAYWHAHRAYQRLALQRQALSMQTTAEAAPLIIKDRILVADVGDASRQAHSGEVREVSGLSVVGSQPFVFQASVNYSVFLQHTDGTVESIPISDPGASSRFTFTLDSAPSLTLVSDPLDGVPTVYTIIRDDEVVPKAYMLSALEPNSSLLFNVSAINYDHLYYFADGLSYHQIGGNRTDRGPLEIDMEVVGTIGGDTDPSYGAMLDADGASSLRSEAPAIGVTSEAVPGGDWSFIAWVNRRADGSYQFLLNVVDGSNALFVGFDGASGILQTGVNNTAEVTAGVLPVGELHHVAATYDHSANRIALFLDGVLLGEDLSTPSMSNVSRPQYLDQYNGLADGICRYGRVLSDDAIMNHFLKTRPAP